jgi:hypothetical protein
MMNELDVLKDVSIRLGKAHLDYMLSGSLAMSYYAQPRMTRDIDIVIHLNQASGAFLYDFFKMDYYLSKEAVDEAVLNESMFNMIHQQAIIKVDFIIRKSSEYRIAEFERRKKITLGDFDTYIVTVEDLIISKIDWMKDSNSELQKRDIKNLLMTEIDRNYLETWLSKLKLREIYDRVIK